VAKKLWVSKNYREDAIISETPVKFKHSEQKKHLDKEAQFSPTGHPVREKVSVLGR
jgi:hypothetical protein